MNEQKMEDVMDTALKPEEIWVYSLEDYFYFKGRIHCLLQKEKRTDRWPREPPDQRV